MTSGVPSYSQVWLQFCVDELAFVNIKHDKACDNCQWPTPDYHCIIYCIIKGNTQYIVTSPQTNCGMSQMHKKCLSSSHLFWGFKVLFNFSLYFVQRPTKYTTSLLEWNKILLVKYSSTASESCKDRFLLKRKYGSTGF